MAKVIVERPRRGGGGDKHGRRANVPLEDRPKRESLRRAHTDTKSLNENLAPLERFIGQNVGRPWDKVYAEICANINVNSAVQAHVRQHVPDLVCLHAKFINGQFYSIGSLFGGQHPLYQPFFVHPRSGILRRNPQYRRYRYRQEQPGPRFLNDDGKTYRPVAGIWYELTFAPVAHAPGTPIYDAVLSRHVPYPYRDLEELYGRPVYVPRKRQLNHREIARLPADRRDAVEAQVAKDEAGRPTAGRRTAMW